MLERCREIRNGGMIKLGKSLGREPVTGWARFQGRTDQLIRWPRVGEVRVIRWSLRTQTQGN